MSERVNRLRRLEWHTRMCNTARTTWSGVACFRCGLRFLARRFEPEVQLLLAGWRKIGAGWVCPTCVSHVAGHQPTVCSECQTAFGLTDASEVTAEGWRRLGDTSVCPTCAERNAQEPA